MPEVLNVENNIKASTSYDVAAKNEYRHTSQNDNARFTKALSRALGGAFRTFPEPNTNSSNSRLVSDSYEKSLLFLESMILKTQFELFIFIRDLNQSLITDNNIVSGISNLIKESNNVKITIVLVQPIQDKTSFYLDSNEIEIRILNEDVANNILAGKQLDSYFILADKTMYIHILDENKHLAQCSFYDRIWAQRLAGIQTKLISDKNSNPLNDNIT